MRIQLFLNGGGTRLAAYLGGLRALEKRGIQVEAWAGASAGSLVAAVLAGGSTLSEAIQLMLTTEYNQFLDMRPFRMIRDFGLCSGTRFERWLEDVLGRKRFGDLDVPFSVVTTDISTGQPYVFSTENTPEASVATAVRCSIGIPGVFGVRRVDGYTLVDGTLTVIEPDMLFPSRTLPKFLMRLMPDRKAPLEKRSRLGLAGYIRRIIEIMLRSADDLSQPHLWDGDLCIQTGAHSSIRFGLTPVDKSQLFDAGYRQCEAWLDGDSPFDGAMECLSSPWPQKCELASESERSENPADISPIQIGVQ